MHNAQGEHSAILSTFIKLPFVIKIFVLSIIEWPFYTDFTVLLISFGPVHKTSILITSVSSKGSGESAHMGRLARALLLAYMKDECI